MERGPPEENGAFAACAEAQITGNLAVCAGTVGPGTLHLINGLYNAKKERVPVLAISGQVARVNMGTNYFQEVGLTKIFDDVCAYQAVIRSAEEAPRIVLKAIQIALEQRAVVRVDPGRYCYGRIRRRSFYAPGVSIRCNTHAVRIIDSKSLRMH